MHAMRKLIILLSALVYVIHAQAQFSVTAHQEGWDNIPPQVQKPGFSFQQSVFANMDGDDALEEVMLFGRDNGHYPTFDLFKAYYAIVDNYTKEIQYISDEIYVTDKYNLLVEDEFDSKMHPLLTCRIITLFNSKETNPKNAQLIFTTHDTNLLSANIFRRDQIWFTQKDRYGVTELYSLAVARVTIKGGMLVRDITSPFTAPKTAPEARPMSIAA